MKLDCKKKKYLIIASIITLIGMGSVLPNKVNQFDEAISVISQKQNISINQLEIVSASHQVFFLFHSVTFELRVKGSQFKSIKTSLSKVPFGNYRIYKYKNI